MHVSTPLDADVWEAALVPQNGVCRLHHPRSLRRLREGITSSIRHAQHAFYMASVIADCIARELGKGRMIDPLPTSWRPLLHVNRFGLIPKGHNNGKFRLITDHSLPHGASANDGISSDLVSLSYITVDGVAEIVQELGRGTLLAKMDIEVSYWLIQVHPQNHILQGMDWYGLCRPLPSVWLTVSTKSIQRSGGCIVLVPSAGWHPVGRDYLDDFIIVAPPDSDECYRAVGILGNTCAKLGVPMAADKSGGPVTALVYLGIVIDTMTGERSLTASFRGLRLFSSNGELREYAAAENWNH